MRTEGIVYIRTARPATEVLYANSDEFTVGGSKMLRQSNEDRATLVATGIGVYSALKAYDELRKQGILTRVIDAYSVKPLDVETLTRAARETRRIIVIEDHWIDGGLGDSVAAALGGIAPVQRLAVTEEPRSGKMEELLERHHISSHAISNAVMTEAAAPH
jgi:transketolase